MDGSWIPTTRPLCHHYFPVCFKKGSTRVRVHLSISYFRIDYGQSLLSRYCLSFCPLPCPRYPPYRPLLSVGETLRRPVSTLVYSYCYSPSPVSPEEPRCVTSLKYNLHNPSGNSSLIALEIKKRSKIKFVRTFDLV